MKHTKSVYPLVVLPESIRQFCLPEQHALFSLSGQVQKPSIERQQQLFQQLNGQVVRPDAAADDVRQGASEQYFFGYLLACLRQTCVMCQGMKFHIPDRERSYSADFVIYHPRSGLAIDCEIDEPYHKENNRVQTCHCTNDGKDKVRNRFFTDRNWLVIRFSEEQVVVHPYACCKFIARYLAQITGDTAAFNQLQSVPDVPIQPCWNNREARHLERTHYRHRYLQRYLGASD